MKLIPVQIEMDLVKSLLVPYIIYFEVDHIIYFDVLVGEREFNSIHERALNSMVRLIHGLFQNKCLVLFFLISHKILTTLSPRCSLKSFMIIQYK